MLKLKKTNLLQNQKIAIEVQQQTHIAEQKTVEQKLNDILDQKTVCFKKILHYIKEESSASISALQFVKVLTVLLKQEGLKNQSDIQQCLQVMRTLIRIPHDFSQVKRTLKKTKTIDPLFLLSLLWRIRSDIECCGKYVSYMIQSYPTQMILNGKQYIRKWQQYFSEQEKKIRLNEQVKYQMAQYQLKQKIKSKMLSNNSHGFVDHFINL